MKKIQFSLALIFILFFTSNIFAQDETALDFWVGKWNLTWDEPYGVKGKGTNRIEKTLDDKVIQEHFEIKAGNHKGLKGTSIAVYSSLTKEWHQAWADNSGIYYNFVGGMKDGNLTFTTEEKKLDDGSIMIQKMIFQDVKKNHFTCVWEKTLDGGKTWVMESEIFYERIE